jgi:hypothetical protein
VLRTLAGRQGFTAQSVKILGSCWAELSEGGNYRSCMGGTKRGGAASHPMRLCHSAIWGSYRAFASLNQILLCVCTNDNACSVDGLVWARLTARGNLFCPHAETAAAGGTGETTSWVAELAWRNALHQGAPRTVGGSLQLIAAHAWHQRQWLYDVP